MDVENIAGLQTALAPTVTLNLPGPVTYDHSNGTCAENSPDVVTCTFTDLPSGQTASVNVTVTVDANAPNGDITALAVVASATSDPDMDNNSATEITTVDALEGTITIVKTTSPAIAGDATFTYASDDSALNGLSLTTINNQASSAVTTVAAGTVGITENETEGWVLTAIDCVGDDDGGTSYEIDMASVQVDLDSGEAIVCTFVSQRDPDDVIPRTSAVIRHFMNERADILTANEPDLVSRLNKRSSPGGALDGSFDLTSDGPSSRFNLTARTSLLAINRAGSSELKGPSQAAQGSEGPPLPRLNPATGESFGTYGLSRHPDAQAASEPPVAPAPEFDIWVETTMGHVENKTSSGSFGIIHIGADQLLREALLIGMMAQIDWLQIDDDTENFEAEGLGWMVGPYMVARLGEHLYFDTRAAWGLSHNSVNPLNLYEDDFDTERWLIRGQLTGQFSLGALTVSPMVRGLYFREKQQSYVDSLDNIIPQQTISLGRLVFGPTLSARYATDSGLVVEPNLAVHGVWNFDPADTADIDNIASLASSQDIHARIETGLTLRYGEGLSITGTAFYDGLGDDSGESYGVKGRVVLPLN
ncbi:MAG: autotransporter domain-containing protein [Rhizobiaceae bacterium]|nr:autotransporter domain-containing protein [Rhizobiaceae bacterium]